MVSVCQGRVYVRKRVRNIATDKKSNKKVRGLILGLTSNNHTPGAKIGAKPLVAVAAAAAAAVTGSVYNWRMYVRKRVLIITKMKKVIPMCHIIKYLEPRWERGLTRGGSQS